ncbi:hypothetical protein [Idiomarina loihiensis]
MDYVILHELCHISRAQP